MRASKRSCSQSPSLDSTRSSVRASPVASARQGSAAVSADPAEIGATQGSAAASADQAEIVQDEEEGEEETTLGTEAEQAVTSEEAVPVNKEEAVPVKEVGDEESAKGADSGATKQQQTQEASIIVYPTPRARAPLQSVQIPNARLFGGNGRKKNAPLRNVGNTKSKGKESKPVRRRLPPVPLYRPPMGTWSDTFLIQQVPIQQVPVNTEDPAYMTCQPCENDQERMAMGTNGSATACAWSYRCRHELRRPGSCRFAHTEDEMKHFRGKRVGVRNEKQCACPFWILGRCRRGTRCNRAHPTDHDSIYY